MPRIYLYHIVHWVLKYLNVPVQREKFIDDTSAYCIVHVWVSFCADFPVYTRHRFHSFQIFTFLLVTVWSWYDIWDMTKDSIHYWLMSTFGLACKCGHWVWRLSSYTSNIVILLEQQDDFVSEVHVDISTSCIGSCMHSVKPHSKMWIQLVKCKYLVQVAVSVIN